MARYRRCICLGAECVQDLGARGTCRARQRPRTEQSNACARHQMMFPTPLPAGAGRRQPASFYMHGYSP